MDEKKYQAYAIHEIGLINVIKGELEEIQSIVNLNFESIPLIDISNQRGINLLKNTEI